MTLLRILLGLTKQNRAQLRVKKSCLCNKGLSIFIICSVFKGCTLISLLHFVTKVFRFSSFALFSKDVF